MKKIVAVAVAVLAVAVAGFMLVKGSSDSKNADVVRIGIFQPFTGDSGGGGKQETLGTQYANYLTPEVEIAGKKYKVELVYADNGSTPDKAPTAAAELVSKNVSIVLGSYGSAVSIAGGPTFRDAGIAAVGITCSNPGVTKDNEYYFRVCFIDPFQGKVLANFANDKFKAKKAYCLGELGNEYDQGLINYFTEAFEGEVIKDSFPTNTSDFSTYLNKAIAEKVDVIFCPVSLAYSTQIIKLAADMKIETPFLGSDTLDSNMVLASASKSNVQLYVSTFYQEGGDPEFDAGIKKWLHEDETAMTNNGGNDTVAGLSAMGYDAYYVALAALQKAGSTDPAKVHEVLPSVEIDSISGHIAFDEVGDAIRDTAFIKKADTANDAWVLEKVQALR